MSQQPRRRNEWRPVWGARSALLCGLAALLSLAANAQSPPAAPTGLTAAPLDGQAALSWVAPSDATITGYEVRHATRAAALATSTWAAISDSASSTVAHEVRSLANGTRYYFQIRAANRNGAGAPSNTATTQLADDPSAAVTVGDANLRTALEGATGKAPRDVITQLDMAKLAGWLALEHRGIADLTGLERAVNVTRLALGANSISDVSPLASLTALTYLGLQYNSVSDVSPLAGLTLLTALSLPYNEISDVSPLGSLTALMWLDLLGNLISDVSRLASNAGLGSDDTIRLQGNPLSVASVNTHIPALRGRGATVEFDARPTSVPAAPDSFTARAIAVEGGVRLRWAGPVYGYIDRYELRSATSTAALASAAWAPAAGSSSTTTELIVPGHLYRIFELRAVNFNGAGPGAVAVAWALAAPTGLTAAPLDAEAALSWTNPSDAAITGYSVRHATSMTALASSTWAAISDSASSTVAHTVRSLANGTRHYFQIRATNAIGDSAPSNTATIHLADAPSAAATISDSNLRTELERATGKSAEDVITQLDIAKLAGTLNLNRRGIADLTGLERAVNVTGLDLSYNSISNVTALGRLTSLTTLNLSGNEISNVTALGRLTSLTTLNLSGNEISNVTALGGLTSLTTLWLGDNEISNVTALGSLTALRWLYLHGNEISDVTALGRLASLTTLGLRDNEISNVTALGSLTALTTLYLHGNEIADVTALGRLASLTTLGLRDNEISNVTALGSLTALTTLYLNDNEIADVTALGRLTSLRWLNLNDNEIADVTALGSLASLTTLYLNNNEISDVTALGRLASLTTLGLGGNEIADVTALGRLASLTNLDLGGNEISDVTALGRLASLRWLNLNDNEIADVTALGSLASLTTLYLNNNEISDVTALGRLASLRWLYLNDNEISDVTALGRLASLRWLYLNDNEISDVAPLGRLTALTWLDLWRNPLSVASLNTHIPAIRGRGATVRYGRRPAAPAGLIAAPLDAATALAWRAPSSTAITGYEVRHATSRAALATSTWAAISDSASSTVAHMVRNLANGTRYYFQIRAANRYGAGAPSNTATTQLADDPSAAVTISDANLRIALERATGKGAVDDITQLDMAQLGTLALQRDGMGVRRFSAPAARQRLATACADGARSRRRVRCGRRNAGP